MKPDTRSRTWRELRPFAGPAIIVAIYVVVRLIYDAASSSRGMLTPSGSLNSKLAALSLTTLAMRIFVLVVVPIVVVYRVVMRLLRKWTRDEPDAR